MSPSLTPALREFLASRPGLFIGDRDDLTAVSGRTLAVEDPSDGSPLAEVPLAGPVEVDRAVLLARAAFADGRWSALPHQRRAAVLHRVAELLERHAEEFALLESVDAGILRSTSDHLAHVAAEVFRHYAGWTGRLYGDVNPTAADLHGYTLRQPLGVVAAIVPWNMPLLMAAFKLAPALAAGNSVVLKPAEQTPLSAQLLARLVREAGLPEGVLAVLTGDGSTGAALVEHPGVDLVGFTGSTRTGQSIQRAAAGTVKRVLLELGGKSANIVFPDADLAAAAQAAGATAWQHSGQICFAGTRLLAHRSIAGELAERIAADAARLRPGPATDPASRLGPLISDRQLRRVLGYLDQARTDGATELLAATRPELPGHHLTPAVLTGVDPQARIAQEEVFGPVLTVLPFDTEEEALRLANGTPYGLAAGVWTGDVSRAHRFARDLRAGTVWVNTYGVHDFSAPSGGFGQSGLGREHGREWIHAYTEAKSVYVQL
ncbi:MULTISPECIES: aldehyde dehydrogenase family protein [Kitasatospora]|uniref:Putative aldehyde dehydrogenase n=1 Tax=Kitasatospora setae (strain ATCC 33774 / DSM 43861 / JCM 3304 / KCC A-0304 / NBRC 14216 / KM-6054) TaxID=452652 RepID=E4N7K7_KITSK|nr:MULTISPECIES: aldehyde dehydrogenase family protein [Kitasatospora]BAJ27188.1 putative aldehyde dehydrogenase [Kitasatospora setae KM-6054]